MVLHPTSIHSRLQVVLGWVEHLSALLVVIMAKNSFFFFFLEVGGSLASISDLQGLEIRFTTMWVLYC